MRMELATKKKFNEFMFLMNNVLVAGVFFFEIKNCTRALRKHTSKLMLA